MVNFQQLWSTQVKKPAYQAESGCGEKAASKMQLIEGSGQDVEADLLPAMVAENRSRRRCKLCCFSWLADVFAVLALVLIVMATGFLLFKLISLKTELDRMGPTVDQMSMEIDQLKNQAATLQAENAALRSGNSDDTVGDDHPLEDVQQDVLRKLKEEADEQAEEQQAEVDMVQMAMVIFAPPNGKNVTTEEVPDFMKTTFAGSFPLDTSDSAYKLDSTTSQEDKDDDDDSEDDTNGLQEDEDLDDDAEETKHLSISRELDNSDNASSTDHD